MAAIMQSQLQLLCIILLVLMNKVSYGIHQPDIWQPIHNNAANYGPAVEKTNIYTGLEAELERFLDQGFPQHSPQQQQLIGKEQCELHKVGFTQDLYFQYILYKTHMPELKEFTLCYWSKFTNHTNDHPIFSYAVDGHPRAIYSWITNTERSSYFSLAVDGHVFYRLNYPLRLNRWYHTCQSWNGKTGEWQVWVNAERVGRGFHNRLVDHIIPGGGIAISGQEQSQPGGGFLEGQGAPKGSGGMLGELTMLQLYNVALTAGKAHRDHKHHHAHQFDHNGNMITTPAPTTPNNRPQLPAHPLLTGGQINRGVRLNLAGGGAPPQLIHGQSYDVQLVNGQLTGNPLGRQYTAGRPQQSPAEEYQQLAPAGNSYSSQQFALGNTQLVNTGFSHNLVQTPAANVQYFDGQQQYGTHALFKRGNEQSENVKTAEEQTEPKFGDKIVAKRQTSSSTKQQSKRELFIAGGTIFDSTSPIFQQSLLDGLAGITSNQVVAEKQKESYDREPAEAEVKAVLNICTGCDVEPFDKALVFGWRNVPKKLYSGAYFTPAVQQCRVF